MSAEAAVPAPVIQMTGIARRFGAVVANDDITFELRPREIHGLLGENGAGRTTLMNILYGLDQPDDGQIRVRGEISTIRSPHAANALGIGMVHQHFMQVPTLTVLDNVILGLESAGGLLLDRETARSRLVSLLKAYGLVVDPDARIWQLSIGDRQRVEILKALYRDVKVLILDEPTSVLTPQETDDLFHTVRRLVADGLSVVLITHRLEEALAITDRITVLRSGKVMGTISTAGTQKGELASLMVGREVLFRLEREGEGYHDPREVLRAENLTALGDRGIRRCKGFPSACAVVRSWASQG